MGEKLFNQFIRLYIFLFLSILLVKVVIFFAFPER